MNALRTTRLSVLFIMVSVAGASAEQNVRLGENAALRYWSAFAQMQDSPISDEQAKELSLVLTGNAPYDDGKYKDLLEKNRTALETMARGTRLQNCDWGLDYELGSDTPVDFVRKGLSLGRLNALYALHLAQSGDKNGTVQALAAGLRFSHDIASGGTLFASAVSTHLLVYHLRTITQALHAEELSAAQRSALRQAIEQIGPEGFDWKSNVRRELGIQHGLDPQSTSALARIVPAYVGVVDQPSTLPQVERLIAGAPASLQKIIPNPERVVEGKRELTEKIQQARAVLH